MEPNTTVFLFLLFYKFNYQFTDFLIANIKTKLGSQHNIVMNVKGGSTLAYNCGRYLFSSELVKQNFHGLLRSSIQIPLLYLKTDISFIFILDFPFQLYIISTLGTASLNEHI
jgi:hypothetical protein